MTQRIYRIEGMDCADCALHVEKGVGQLKEITFSQVDLASARLTVEGGAPVEAIRQRVEALGYRLVDPSASSEESPTHPKENPVVGFLRFLLAKNETRLALAGGGLLLLAELLRWVGLPAQVISGLQIAALVVAGYPVARGGIAALFLSRSFSIDLLMTIAALGALILGDLSEAAALIFLFDIAEALEGFTTDRARSVLSSLQDLAPAHALRLTEQGEGLVPVAILQVGDRILVRPGERIPMDGQVLQGSSEVNQAPITGESMPVNKVPGDPLYAGTVNGGGALEVRVESLAQDSTLARIIRMVTEAQSRRAPSQRIIDRFAQVYTPAVIVVALLVAVVPPFFWGQPFFNPAEGGTGWFYRALALLVIACPCALVISAPVTILSGIISAARQGVLIKGGAYLEELAGVRRMAFDKTGTLTRGRPAVTASHSVDCTGADNCPACEDLLALAGALERRSTHPLAYAVVETAGERGLLERYQPAESVIVLEGAGLQGRVDGRLATIGNHTLFDRDHPHSDTLCAQVQQAEALGQTTMLLCDGDRVRGFIAVADEIRPESRQVIAELKALGIQPAMLTGDNPTAAQRVADDLGISTVWAGLLPEDKVSAVQKLRAADGSLAMIGDGINDAPALAAANLGIAMGGAGSAQAMETADVVLMGGDLTRLPFAVRDARLTRRLIIQNIVFSLVVKLALMLLAMGGLANLWMAVLGDMGVSLLVTFNGLRPLALKK